MFMIDVASFQILYCKSWGNTILSSNQVIAFWIKINSYKCIEQDQVSASMNSHLLSTDYPRFFSDVQIDLHIVTVIQFNDLFFPKSVNSKNFISWYLSLFYLKCCKSKVVKKCFQNSVFWLLLGFMAFFHT